MTNSLQEYRVDKLMTRTAGRTVALERISKSATLFHARILFALGLLGLYVFSKELSALLAGASGVLVYNFVYTPLKHKTVWAIIAGAISGFLPPYIGWLAGGGTWFSTRVILVCGLFFLWQVPHYWLVVLNYKNDYIHSPLPSIIKEMGEKKLRLLVFPWVVSLAVIVHILLLFNLQIKPLAESILSIATILLIVFFAFVLFMLKKPRYQLLFITLNAYILLVMVVMSTSFFYQI